MGRPTTTQIGGNTIFTQAYNTDGTLLSQSFANGGQMRYGYDSYKWMIGSATELDSGWRYQYTYGANGELARLTDNNLGRVIHSEYDLTGRPMRKTTEASDGTPIYTGEVSYDDEHGLLASFMERMGTESGKHVTAFTYDEINRCTGVSFTAPTDTSTTHSISTALDGFSRVTTRTVSNGSHDLTITYTYAAGANGGTTSSRVSTISQINSAHKLTYTYTNAGLIASVKIGTKTISYTYDAIGQLTQVNDPTDTTAGTTGTTWKYTYDYGGNIQTKKAYEYGTTTEVQAQRIVYTYGNSAWKDQLTKIKIGTGTAKTISYDAVGNPLTDGTWSYTWQAGRQLKQMSKTGETVQFYYNDEGLRVRKTATTTGTTEYTLHGKQIVHMTNGTSELHFYYGSDGKPAFVRLGTSWYAYVYNLQGDVIALTDSSGTVVVEYRYDAWGKLLATTGTLASSLGKLNPFRYRGYVYDEETGLYYCTSRLYNPNIGKFSNTDALIKDNLYQYCLCSPTNAVDSDGYDPFVGQTFLSPMPKEAAVSDEIRSLIIRQIQNTIERQNSAKGIGCFVAVEIKHICYSEESQRYSGSAVVKCGVIDKEVEKDYVAKIEEKSETSPTVWYYIESSSSSLWLSSMADSLPSMTAQVACKIIDAAISFVSVEFGDSLEMYHTDTNYIITYFELRDAP